MFNYHFLWRIAKLWKLSTLTSFWNKSFREKVLCFKLTRINRLTVDGDFFCLFFAYIWDLQRGCDFINIYTIPTSSQQLRSDRSDHKKTASRNYCRMQIGFRFESESITISRALVGILHCKRIVSDSHSIHYHGMAAVQRSLRAVEAIRMKM